jgi:hypothetical protein
VNRVNEIAEKLVPSDWDAEMFKDVAREYHAATGKHGGYASAHEGHSVIREEMDELWEHVRANTGYSEEAYHEAKQIAATALKFMALCVSRRYRQL